MARTQAELVPARGCVPGALSSVPGGQFRTPQAPPQWAGRPVAAGLLGAVLPRLERVYATLV